MNIDVNCLFFTSNGESQSCSGILLNNMEVIHDHSFGLITGYQSEQIILPNGEVYKVLTVGPEKYFAYKSEEEAKSIQERYNHQLESKIIQLDDKISHLNNILESFNDKYNFWIIIKKLFCHPISFPSLIDRLINENEKRKIELEIDETEKEWSILRETYEHIRKLK